MSRAQRPGRWWLLSLIILLGVWVLSSGSDTPGPQLHHPLDWLAHGLTYLALAYSLTRATGRPMFALVFAAWYGALDEVHQAFVPGRESGLPDWLADLTGAWLGARLACRRETRDSAAPYGAAPDGAGQPRVPVLSDPAP